MKRIIAVAMALISATLVVTGVAQAQTPLIRNLLEVEFELNNLCRGAALGDYIDKICGLRDKMDRALNNMGYCYGKEGQYGYQMQWHKCTKGSMRLSD